jgi:uncharacterized membrane protein YphA (DoxX/SURF4 family)
MSNAVTAQPSTRAAGIAAWGLQLVLALIYFAAAGAKLSGVPMMVDVFEQIGLGQWFRFVTAFVEIGGAVALLVPGLAGPASLWLGCTMIGAIIAHLTVLHTPALPPAVLLLLNLVVAWLRRDQIFQLMGRL